MTRTSTLNKLKELADQVPSLNDISYDHPRFKTWYLSVESILLAHLGDAHTISMNFRNIEFKVDPFVEMNRGRDASTEEHQRVFLKGLETADAVLDAAIEVWFNSAPAPGSTASSKNSPVQVNLTNNNSSNSTSNASATASSLLEFPLDDLLALIDASDDLTEEQKPEAKEVIENLDGELRKRNPRWDKIAGHLKNVADLGKEVAIQTFAAVVAEYSKNRFGF